METMFSNVEVRDLLIHNAFNSFGDVTGSDDFGCSYAWVDLHDYLSTPEGRALMPNEIEELERIVGGRYAIVFWWASGVVNWDDYDNKDAMMKQFREFQDDFYSYELNIDSFENGGS